MNDRSRRFGYDECGILEWVAPTPNVTAGGAALDQANFRVRDDSTALNTDGGWISTENQATLISIGTGTANKFRVRFTVDETANKADGFYVNVLRYSRNGGAYIDIDTSTTPVRFTDGLPTDDAACDTQLLGSPSGSFANDGVYTESGHAALTSFAKDEFREYEACLYFVDADVNDTDEFEFRIYGSTSDTSTPFATYSNTPLITVSKPPAYEQRNFRVRDDSTALNTDGGWISTENAAPAASIETGTANRFRIRFTAKEIAGTAGTVTFQLRKSKNAEGGPYTAVTASSADTQVTGGLPSDGATCAIQLLGAEGGSFEGDGSYDEVDGVVSAWLHAGLNYAEFEWCLYLVDADVADGDDIFYRVYQSDGTVLDDYLYTARVVVSKGGAVQGDGTVTGSADAAATATVTHNADGTVTGSAEATGTARTVWYNSGTVTGSATAEATGGVKLQGDGTVTGSAEASGTATVTHNASASVTGTAYTSGTATVVHRNSATVTGAAYAEATGQVTVKGAGTVTGSAEATGTATVTHGAVVTVTGSAEATATADVTHRTSVTVTGSAEATGTGRLSVSGVGTAAGSAFASAVATVRHFALATAAGVAFAAATGTVVHNAQASVTGQAEATATASVTHSGAGTAAGAAYASATAQVTHSGVGTATGQAFVSGTAVQDTAHAEVTGKAYASATGSTAVPGAVTVTGSAEATGTGSTAVPGSGTATGTAEATATGTVQHSAIGTATGTAEATATGTVQHSAIGTATGSAEVTGTGSVTQQGVGAATGTAFAGGDATVTHHAVGTATGIGYAAADGTATGQAPEGTITGQAYASASATVAYRGYGTASGKAYAEGTLTAGDFSAKGTITGKAYAWAGELPGWSYIAYLDDGIWFRLARYSPLYGTQIIASVSYEHEPNVYYNIVLEADGTALNAKVWSDAESEPAWMIEETDGEFASGAPGIVALSTTEVLFDVFSTGLGGDPYPLGRLPGAPVWLLPHTPVYVARSDPALTLEWTQPTMTNDVLGGVVAYELEYQRDGDTAWTQFWRGYERTYDWDMSNLLAGEYCVRVRAYVGCEYGPWAELCGISFEGVAPVFETPDGYYFGDDQVGLADHGMWIRLFQASHTDDGTPVNACLVSRELILAGVGGECLFKKLYLNLTYTTDASVVVTPIVDGEVIEDEARTLNLASSGGRVVDRFEIDLTRGYDVEGTERFRYGMRGSYFQVKVCVTDIGGTGRVEIDGVALIYTVARETHAWARPFYGELETDVEMEEYGGYYFGTETDDVPAALYKHGGETDFGFTVTPHIEPRMVAPFGLSIEAWFRTLYLCVTRNNLSDWTVEVTPIIDGTELETMTVVLAAVDQPKTEIFELPLSRPYDRTDIEQSRYGVRGLWFTYRIRTVGRRPAGEVSFDGSAIEAIPCRETEAGA